VEAGSILTQLRERHNIMKKLIVAAILIILVLPFGQVDEVRFSPESMSPKTPPVRGNFVLAPRAAKSFVAEWDEFLRDLPTGNVVPTVTPFIREKDGNLIVDQPAVRRLLLRIASFGQEAILANGATGEFDKLPNNLRQEALTVFFAERDKIYASGGPFIRIIANVTGSDEAETLENIERFKDLCVEGKDTLLVCPLFYLKSNDEIIAHFERIREITQAPIALYNNHGLVRAVTGREEEINIDPEIVAELFQRRWVFAIKDSSGDMDTLKSYIATGIPTYQGNEGAAFEALQAGARGLVGSTGNISEIMELICRMHQQGLIEEAQVYQDIVNQYRSSITINLEKITPALKQILAEQGLCEVVLAKQGSQLSEDERIVLMDAYRKLQFPRFIAVSDLNGEKGRIDEDKITVSEPTHWAVDSDGCATPYDYISVEEVATVVRLALRKNENNFVTRSISCVLGRDVLIDEIVSLHAEIFQEGPYTGIFRVKAELTNGIIVYFGISIEKSVEFNPEEYDIFADFDDMEFLYDENPHYIVKPYAKTEITHIRMIALEWREDHVEVNTGVYNWYESNPYSIAADRLLYSRMDDVKDLHPARVGRALSRQFTIYYDQESQRMLAGINIDTGDDIIRALPGNRYRVKLVTTKGFRDNISGGIFLRRLLHNDLTNDESTDRHKYWFGPPEEVLAGVLEGLIEEYGFTKAKEILKQWCEEYVGLSSLYKKEINQFLFGLENIDENRNVSEEMDLVVQSTRFYRLLSLIPVSEEYLFSHEKGNDEHAARLVRELEKDDNFSWPIIAFMPHHLLRYISSGAVTDIKMGIIDGEHRTRAARAKGLNFIPALISDDPLRDLTLKGWDEMGNPQEKSLDQFGNKRTIFDVAFNFIKGETYPPKVTRFISEMGRVINLPCRLNALSANAKIVELWARDLDYIRFCHAGRNLIIDRLYEEDIWFCDVADDIPDEVLNDPDSVIDFKKMRENAQKIRKALAGDSEALAWFRRHQGMFNGYEPLSACQTAP